MYMTKKQNAKMRLWLSVLEEGWNFDQVPDESVCVTADWIYHAWAQSSRAIIHKLIMII